VNSPRDQAVILEKLRPTARERGENDGTRRRTSLVNEEPESVGGHLQSKMICLRTRRIRLGYELVYECPQPTPMLLMLNVHYTRVSELMAPDHLVTSPLIPIGAYRDGFGNWCSRILAPTGRTRQSAKGIVNDTGEPDVVATDANQHVVEDLPDDALPFLLASRYCGTDRLSEIA
jgi:hypothetical protein